LGDGPASIVLPIATRIGQADLQNFVRKSAKPALQDYETDRASQVDRGSYESSE